MKRRIRFGVTATTVVAAAVTAAPLLAGRLPLSKVVAGSDCGRFVEPDVSLAVDPDPQYDPEQGEAVSAIDLDPRTLDVLLEAVTAAQAAQVQAAHLSLQRALDTRPSTSPGPVLYEATVSFDHVQTLQHAAEMLIPYGLVLETVGHAYAAINDVYVGEIPAITPDGLARTIQAIEDEYLNNTRVLLERAEVYVGHEPGIDGQQIIADARSRVDAAVADGMEVIGVTVSGTLDQIAALSDTVNDIVVGVVPPGCEPQNAIVPDAFLPMIAHQALDRPETRLGPLAVTSPGPEGR